MKHASIDPCTRVPNNCKYTESVVHPVFTAIQRFAEDLLSIARHYIAQYYNKGELSFVE